jgi:hypothetical protein
MSAKRFYNLWVGFIYRPFLSAAMFIAGRYTYTDSGLLKKEKFRPTAPSPAEFFSMI